MANTIAVVKIPGTSLKMAYGTVASVGDATSFSILDKAGSQVMRNSRVVILTPLGTSIGGGSAQAMGYGSTSGYIHVNITNHGSFTQPVASGTVDLNFQVIGGGGST